MDTTLEQIKEWVRQAKGQPFYIVLDGKEGCILSSKYGPAWMEKATLDDIRRIIVR